jgi:hypothetical protein
VTKVYVVVWEPYHDNGSLYGVFSSIESAERSEPGVEFSRHGWYVDNREGCVSQGCTDSDCYLIYEREVKS